MHAFLIEDQDGLRQAGDRLRHVSRVALDCEAAGFHRYSDRLCLVQLSTSRETFLFDPLAVDPGPTLATLLEDPRVQIVIHGADYDLRLLDRDLGVRVRGLFDTQAAAFLIGASAVGLAALVEKYLGVTLAKEHQRADWARRPLTPELLAYAAADTRHLLDLSDLLQQDLEALGRKQWAEEEFRALEEISWEEDNADPLTRVKGARELNAREATALRAALEWRDRIARARDRAPFRVVTDAILLAVVKEPPTTVEALAATTGFSSRLARQQGRHLLEAMRAVEALPEKALRPYPRGPRNARGRPSLEEETLANRIRALRTGKAQDLGLDRGVLLSNTQIAEVVRLRPPNPEALQRIPGIRRWQAEVLGDLITPLFA